MTLPRVSVVIAARNAEAFLGEALASVRAQTWHDLEVLVVDGHSTDRTAAIARAFPGVRCLPQQGRGFAAAWNQGVREARGEWIAFLDSDDRWLPDKLRWQAGHLESNPGALAVVGHVRFFVTGEAPRHFRPELLAHSHVAYMPGALLARRELFQLVGDFPTEWRIASDVDWFARAKDAGVTIGVVPEVVLEKRVHQTNLSYTGAAEPSNLARREILDVLRRSAARQRAAGSRARG